MTDYFGGGVKVPLTENFGLWHQWIVPERPERMSPFTVDAQTLLHLKAKLTDLRLCADACPACGGETDRRPHAPDCPMEASMSLVDAMLSDEYQQVFTRARLRHLSQRAAENI